MIASTIAEIAGAIFGVGGSLLLALNTRHSGWGFVAFLASNLAWILFAWLQRHFGLMLQHACFTLISATGIFMWLVLPRLRGEIEWWDEWRGTKAGHVVMRIKSIATWRGRRVDLHQMVDADAAGCFHTHPARAVRIILWAGYTEEIEGGATRRWWPGMVGLVRPELSHRIAAVHGRASYSLWIRGRKSHPVQLRGDGWPPGSAPA